MKGRFGILGFLLWLAAPLGAETSEPSGPLTLTVLNFVNRNPGDGWDWLEKGLADMLITDLSASLRLRLVERERVQVLLEELRLAEVGLTEEKCAARLGRMLKADLALHGSYLVRDGTIQIEAHILEVATGALRRVETASGKVEEVLRLEKDLAERTLARLDLPLTGAEQERLRRFPTQKVDAAACYYRGMDYFDKGEYLDALGQFRLGVRGDPEYHQARFRAAQMFDSCGEPDHALVEFERLNRRGRQSPYGSAGALYCARIRSRYPAPLAAEEYLAVVRDYPGTIPAVLAAYEAAKAFQYQRDDERAYAALLSVHENAEACALRIIRPQVPWYYFEPVLQMNQQQLASIRLDAMSRMYAILTWWSMQGKRPDKVPSHVLYLSEDQPALKDVDIRQGFRTDNSPPWWIAHPNGPHFSRYLEYLLLPPPGKAFRSLRVTLHARPCAAPHPSYYRGPPLDVWKTCRVHVKSPSLHPPETYCTTTKPVYTWPFTDKQVLVEREGDYPVEGKLPPDCRGACVWMQDFVMTELTSWSLEATYQPAGAAEESRMPPEVRGALRPERPAPPVGRRSAFRDRDGKLAVVYADMDMLSGGSKTKFDDADLWLARFGQDGRLGDYQPFPFNSTSHDYDPWVARDREGAFWLVFVSRRRLSPDGDIYISRSADGRNLTFPRRIELGLTPEELKPRGSYSPSFRESYPRFFQPWLLVDSTGRFWLSFVLADSPNGPGNHFLTNSSDGVTWRKPLMLGGSAVQDAMASLCQTDQGGVLDLFMYGDDVTIANVDQDLTHPMKAAGGPGRRPFTFFAPGHTQFLLPGRWHGRQVMVYRRYNIQRKVYPDGRTSGGYFTNKDLFVCTSLDGENWETYKLTTELPFGSQPGVGLLEGDVLTLISGWGHAQLERHDLAKELTDEARLPPVMDDEGRRLPATAGKFEPPAAANAPPASAPATPPK